MKYINDGLTVMKGNAGPSMKRAVNNAAFSVLEKNKKTLLGSQIIAWHEMDMKTRLKLLRDEFHQRLPDARDFQVDGILANFYVESRFATAMQNRATSPFERRDSGSGALGLAQWNDPSRFRALLTAGAKFAAFKEQEPLLLSYLHPSAQVDTVMYELTSSHKTALTHLLSSASFEKAVASWLRYYEGIVASDVGKHGDSYSSSYRIGEFRKIK